ncbi:YkyA family protein [Neobacillus niacini]|uniref:YkyA family protein n=1 Tax=Neobacillus niacini TaxID=86668 RepID=UPI00285A5BBD|nr:YkyA family protein [Neobacillus niacini]MDR6998071.1 peptidoglycan hydrolase CwlO-like protein [Neobacillus niacini]
MPFISKSCLWIFIISTVMILSGCFNQKTPIEKIYDVLEKVVAKEKGFENQQEPLVALEKKEKAIYDQIMSLGMKQYDKVVKLADTALAIANKRKRYMKEETESIMESKETFQKIKEYKNELKDSKLKKSLDHLYQIMMDRYSAHDELNKEYLNALKLDKQLYGLFKNKNLSFDTLEAKVNKVNEAYQKVYAANKKFNQLTKDYNSQKLAFYKMSGLKISE